jgi:uncharacterized membrane protein YfcA
MPFILTLVALVTAVISGVFGMAGGMILMGVYAALLPVTTAMVLHGITQLAANSMRAVILFRHVYVKGCFFYALGALGIFCVLYQARYVPDPKIVFLVLGLSPFVAALIPPAWLDFDKPHAAFITGINVAGVQLLAGAAGPLLDISFIDTRLGREQIVATKAITQVFSHSIKLAYFIPLLARGALPPTSVVGILVATVIGTVIGTRILQRLSNESFRNYSRAIVFATGVFYLGKAAYLFLQA